MGIISIENSVFTKRPDLIMYFADLEDSKKYMPSSTEKVNLVCPDCGCIKESTVINLHSNGFTCPRCGDGISYPNKIMFSLLEQLNIPFINEFTPEWAMGRRYDFYFELNNKEYVVEMDGNFHFVDNGMSGQTKEESKRVDDEKDLYAEQNHVKMIRIVSRKSSVEYLKKRILHSLLNKLFDLSNIDWIKCGEYAVKSLVKRACDLCNEGNSVKGIADIMHMKPNTIWTYLDKGVEIGLCNYQPTNRRPVICLETREIFSCCKEAGMHYNIFITNITSNCKGKTKSAGNYHWMFYDEYLKVDGKNKNIDQLIKQTKIHRGGVICLTTYEIFGIIKKAGKKYNICDGNITVNAQGHTSYAGKLPDGTPLKWMYYDDYVEKYGEPSLQYKLAVNF